QLAYVLPYHGAHLLFLPYQHEQPDIHALASSLRGNALRFWELTGCGYLFGPTQVLGDAVAQSPDLSAVAYFNLAPAGNGSVTFVKASAPQSQWVLVAFKRGLPRAALYQRWLAGFPDEVAAQIADPAWDPALTVLVEGAPAGAGGSGAAPVPASFDFYSTTRVEMTADSPGEGLLLLNDRFHPDWRATVDGRPAQIMRCNELMRGVRVGPGRHKVVLSYHSPFAWAVRLQAATLIALFPLLPLARLRVSAIARRKKPSS
ncbi:MAG: YfhO family protein, partial [Planctomycetes bacterium]|nr:YfhO family protein [Planctomycetota bacterium]